MRMHNLMVKVKDEDYEKFRKRCRDQGMSCSQVVRMLMDDFVKNERKVRIVLK